MTAYFITGGFGFLGQYIVKAIHDHDTGIELRVLTRTPRDTYLHLERLDHIRWVTGELTKPETFEEHLQGVDTVIHNAALVSFRKSDAEKIFQSNVIGTRNLTKAALESGCRNFIFISSISAIGVEPPKISDESMIPDLDAKRRTDMYGYSKLISELELKEIADQKKMRVITLNPSVVLGPGSDRIETVFRAARLLPVLPMLPYINSFVDVRDVANAVILALTKGQSGKRYIVTAHNIDMLSFTRLTLQAVGRKMWIIPVSGSGAALLDGLLWLLDLLKLNPGIRRISEMNVDKTFSSERIKREMGWESKYTLEQSIKDSVSETES